MHFIRAASLLFLMVAVVSSCNTSNRANSNAACKTLINGRYSTGRFSNSELNFVRSFLSSYSNLEGSDTLIIRYDFNDDNCWNALELQSDIYIKKVVASHRSYFDRFQQNHPHKRVFEFKENGNLFSKRIGMDSTLLTDSTGNLFQKIIKERTSCGTSMMIFPEGTFIQIKGDPHSEIFCLTDKQIARLMGK